MNSSILRTAMVCAVFAVLILTCAAQDNSTAERERKFTSTTELVLVPVLVHDKSGKHVAGLTKDDFQVSEAGKAQNIAVFEEVKASTAQPNRTAAADGVYSNMLQQDRSSKRVVVIAIDQVNSAYLDQARARRQLTEQLVEAVGDGALTALVRIDPRGVKVIHDFTADPQVLVAGLKLALAAEKGEISPTEFNRLEPQRQDFGATERAEAIKDFMAPNSIRASIREFFEKYNEFLHQKVNYADQSNAIELTLDAMEHIAHSLAGIPGRKSLIWLTGSFPLSLNPMSEILRGQGAAYLRRTVQALNDANVALYPVDVRGVINTAEGLDDSYPTQLTVRHRNTDTPELRAEDPNKLHYEAMRAFAYSTGGVPFYNNNNVPTGIRNAIEDSSAYYMLAYYRSEKQKDGEWRPVSVKVRGSGLQVRSRSGYYAGQTGDKVTNVEMLNAMDSPWDYTGVPVAIRWSGAAAGQGEKKKVPFEIRVNGPAMDLSRHRLQLEYAAAVKELDGKTITRWGETVEGNITPEQEKQIATAGITHRSALSLPAGKYLVRFVVRDDVTGHIGSVQAPLEVK